MVCSTRSTTVAGQRAVDARSTRRLTPSGCSVSGNTTVPRSGRTGSSAKEVVERSRPSGRLRLEWRQGILRSRQPISPQPEAGTQGRVAVVLQSISVVRFAAWTNVSFSPRSPSSDRLASSVPAAAGPTTIDPMAAPHQEGADPAGANERDRVDIRQGRRITSIAWMTTSSVRRAAKRFEIPSHRALVFLEELEGLPQDDTTSRRSRRYRWEHC